MQPQQHIDDHYTIKSVLADGQMFVTLQVKNQNKITKLFTKSFSEQNLSEEVKKNFKDIDNVHSILNQTPESCKVDIDKGIITIFYQVVFRNGNKLSLQGNLQLQQIVIPTTKEQNKLDESVLQKFQKLEEDIKQLQQLFVSDSKIKNEQIIKVSKQIVSDVQQLKQRYQQIKYWKKQQQLKLKQLQQFYQMHKNQQRNQPKIGLSDQLMHIIDQKLNENKQVFTQKFQKQAEKIQDLQNNTVRMKNTIDKLSQQNLQLKKITKSCEQASKILLSKNQTLQAEIKDLVKKNQKVVKFLNSKDSQPQKQHKKQEPNLFKQTSEKQFKPNKSHNPFYNQPKQKNVENQKPQINPEQIFKAFFSGAGMTSPRAQQQKSMNAQKTFSIQSMQIHPSSAYSKQFIYNGKAITYNGITQDHTQLVGNLKVSNQRLSFISIIKTKRNQIGFGVIDLKYLNQRNSVKSTNCIMLCGGNGALYDGGVFVSADNIGFKQGDKVKMRINPIQGFIQFSIAGTVIKKYKSQKLKDQGIQWAHFVRLCDKGDTLKWTLQ